jgi:hypothetical protein
LSECGGGYVCTVPGCVGPSEADHQSRYGEQSVRSLCFCLLFPVVRSLGCVDCAEPWFPAVPPVRKPPDCPLESVATQSRAVSEPLMPARGITPSPRPLLLLRVCFPSTQDLPTRRRRNPTPTLGPEPMRNRQSSYVLCWAETAVIDMLGAKHVLSSTYVDYRRSNA